MRRMKVVLVLLCVLAPLAMCQQQKARSMNRTDKTEKGKYKPNYVADNTRTSRIDELIEDEGKFNVYRNNRAIDSNRYNILLFTLDRRYVLSLIVLSFISRSRVSDLRSNRFQADRHHRFRQELSISLALVQITG